MSKITDIVADLNGRLTEVESEIASLSQEADQLRQAINSLNDIAPATTSRSAAPRRGGQRAKAAKAPAKSSNGRAPRGQNRERILAAIAGEAKTAGQIASETGIGRPTIASTLSTLVADGVAVKAPRGYKAA